MHWKLEGEETLIDNQVWNFDIRFTSEFRIFKVKFQSTFILWAQGEEMSMLQKTLQLMHIEGDHTFGIRVDLRSDDILFKEQIQ